MHHGLPTIGGDPHGHSALAGAASAGASAAGVKKKTTRRYNASCDACRARKRKCPGRDPATGVSMCTACGDRGVPCTYGNLGEPSRLRRADNENEKLKTAIREALEAGDLDEKDRILQTFLKNGGEVKSEGGIESGDGAAPGGGGSGRKKRGPAPGAKYAKKQRTDDPGSYAEHGHHYQQQQQYGAGQHYYPSEQHGHEGEYDRGYSPNAPDHYRQQQQQQQHDGDESYRSEDQHDGHNHQPHPQRREVDRLIAADERAESPRPVSSEGRTSSAPAAQFTSNTIANTRPAEEQEDVYELVASYARDGLYVLAVRELGIELREAERMDDYDLQMVGGPTPQEEEMMLAYYFCWLNPRYSLLDEGLLRKGKENKDFVFASPLLMWSLYAHIAVHCPGFQEKRKVYRVSSQLTWKGIEAD